MDRDSSYSNTYCKPFSFFSEPELDLPFARRGLRNSPNVNETRLPVPNSIAILPGFYLKTTLQISFRRNVSNLTRTLLDAP